jgi:hypothetical protein
MDTPKTLIHDKMDTPKTLIHDKIDTPKTLIHDHSGRRRKLQKQSFYCIYFVPQEAYHDVLLSIHGGLINLI